MPGPYAISGRCFLTPTGARTGGDEVPGIFDEMSDAITFYYPSAIEYARVGLGAKGGLESRAGHEQPALLLIPLKHDGVNSRDRLLKMIWAHCTTNGTAFQPTGTGATGAHGTPPSFAMIVRPTISTELHIYSPTWRLATGADQQTVFSQVIAQIGPNILPLIANRAHGATTRPWLWGSASAINTEYSLSDA